MAKCSKCGKSVSDDIKFCPDCGGKIKQINETSANRKTRIPINVVYIILSSLLIFSFFLGLITAKTACKDYTGTSFPENGICKVGEVSTFYLGASAWFLLPISIFVSIISSIVLILNLSKKKYGYELYASIAGVMNIPVIFLGFSEYGIKSISLLILPAIMLVLSILDFRRNHK